MDINHHAMKPPCGTALHIAASYGRDDCVDVLINAGADLDAVDIGGSTPLHRASYFRNAQCIRLLIRAGARVNLTDSEGLTAYQVAEDEETRAVFSEFGITK